MFTRVLLNITKHKVLNILLVFLLILSFAGITLSSVFAYKTNGFLNKIYDEEDVVLLSSEALDSDGYSFGYSMDAAKFDVYVDIYEKIRSEYKDLDVKLDFNLDNLSAKQLPSSEEEVDGGYFYKSVYFVHSLSEFGEMYNVDNDFDKNKIYITPDVAEEYGVKVGDVIDFETSEGFAFMDFGDSGDVEGTSVGQLEIGGILEPTEQWKREMGGSEYADLMAYIPVDALLTLDTSTMTTYYSKIIISGDDSQMKKVYDDVKNQANDMHVYYSKNIEDKDLEFFVKIKNFFIITLITAIVIFALSMVSLNNNIMERRNSEFRLYNVFGVGTGELLVQLILEKLSLIIFSLIIAVPLFLKLVLVGTNIVDNIVEYSLRSEMLLVNLLYSTERYELVNTLSNGTTGIKVNNFLIIMFGLVIMLIITVIIVLIQLILNRNSIVNQRRGV